MRKIVLIILSIFVAIGSKAQQLTLEKAIEIARAQSLDAAVSMNELKRAYWEYRTYRANLLPEVNFTATLPDYRKSYSLYQSETGGYKFVRNNSLRLDGELSVDQNIWWTGGKISINSSLQYIDPLGSDVGSRHFMSVPIGITLFQPIFGTNHIKWQCRIEPVRYQEAKAAYIESVEKITLNTISRFFQLLLAKENLNVALQNKKNADRLAEIAAAKRKMGQLSENELLQLKLSALKATSDLTNERSNLNAAMFALRSFLGLSEKDSISAVIPEPEEFMILNYADVLNKALENNSFAQNIRRRQLEADYEVAKAEGDRRKIDLYASFGYTGQDDRFRGAYNNVIENQVVQIGVRIPILDWGKRRGQVKIAESNREVVNSKIKQEQMNFNQDLFILVEQFNNQAEQLRIARAADTIAQKRYETSIESFMIGQINTLDLNDAQISKDNARRKLVSELNLYWYYTYQIRSITLFDFRHNCNLEADFERLIFK